MTKCNHRCLTLFSPSLVLFYKKKSSFKGHGYPKLLLKCKLSVSQDGKGTEGSYKSPNKKLVTKRLIVQVYI